MPPSEQRWMVTQKKKKRRRRREKKKGGCGAEEERRLRYTPGRRSCLPAFSPASLPSILPSRVSRTDWLADWMRVSLPSWLFLCAAPPTIRAAAATRGGERGVEKVLAWYWIWITPRGDKCLLYCLSNESPLSSITHTHTHMHTHTHTHTHTPAAAMRDQQPLLKTQQPYFLPKKRLQSRHCLLSDRTAWRLVFVLCPLSCVSKLVQRCNQALGHKAVPSAPCAAILLQEKKKRRRRRRKRGQPTVGLCGKCCPVGRKNEWIIWRSCDRAQTPLV